MTKNQKIAVTLGIVIVPLVLLLLFNALVLSPLLAETQAEGRGLSVSRFTNPVRLDQTLAVQGAATFADDLTVTGDIAASSIVTEGNASLVTLSTTGNITVAGNATIAGTTALVGNVTLSGFTIRSSASITPTDGGTITPTAELMTLTPGGALGTALGACTTGTQVVLYNSLNANVVITDTGNGVLAGNQTLGQYDALGLVCLGTKWVQVSALSAN